MAKVTHGQIAQAVLAMLENGQNPAKVSNALASYLIDERRSRELDSIIRDLETLRYRRNGILEATVVSATELDLSIDQTIKDLLAAKQVHLHHHLNPDLVGGVRVNALDKQLDLSIRAKLKHLKSASNRPT
jgi:F-type H+-transporting ATPase subunit delta